MWLKPDRSFKLPVFKCLESFINVCKQIYPFISEFARQITIQIPICEHDSTNNQIVKYFVCGYMEKSDTMTTPGRFLLTIPMP